MILVSARREIILQWRDGRISSVSLVLAIASLAVLIMGWLNYQEYQHDYMHFKEEIREQWVDQGKRHPHRAAHYGIYVSKPASSLSILEPGLAPVTGQAIWLNAHDRTTYSNPPAHDDIIAYSVMSNASPAAVVSVLGGLFALTLGALGIVRERENGVMRQIIAQGTRQLHWVVGKLVGLFVVVSMPFIPILIIVSLILILDAPKGAQLDTALRITGFVLVNAGLLFVMLCVGLFVSCFAKTARSALLVAFSIWIAVFIVSPRAAAAWIERVHPTINWEGFQTTIATTFNQGFDERLGYSEQLAKLERDTLKKHGVTRLAELPVGFSGIRMIHMSSWSSEVSDRAYGEILLLWSRQTKMRNYISLVFPYLAARSASQNMAAADWPHFRAFNEASESYRRDIVLQLDEVLRDELSGEVWEMDSDANVWAQTASFSYRTPQIAWAIGQAWPSFLIVLAWIVGSFIALRLAAKKLII